MDFHWKQFTQLALLGSGLTREDWRMGVDQLANELGGGFGGARADLRDVTARHYIVLRAAPDENRQDYQSFREALLYKAGLDARAGIEFGHLMLDSSGSDTAVLWQLAINLRALDEALGEDVEITNDPTSRFKLKAYGCFLIPVNRQHRLEDGKNFERRAMGWHALLPECVGSNPIKLYGHPDAAAREKGLARSHLRVAAAIFPDLDVDLDDSKAEVFRVLGITCENASTVVVEQINEARATRSNVVMWPELTVPPDILSAIRAKLAIDRKKERQRLDVVAAGTWHVSSDSHAAINVLEILDDRGSSLLSYKKRLKFRVGGMAEDIQPGAELPILLMVDRLIGIGICRDFCDDTHDVPYGKIDADLVLVPSMGHKTTILAHQKFAGTLQHRFGTRVFIVQQTYPPPGPGPHPADLSHGFVIPPTGAALTAPILQLVQRECFAWHDEA